MFKKGYKKQTKGKNKHLSKKGKTQQTLIEMFMITKENDKPEEVEEEKKEEEEVSQKMSKDNEESLFETEANMLFEMVKEHKLNEIVVYFQKDIMHIRMSIEDLRKLFQIIQKEVINEFGAPISLSLFPNYLLKDEYEWKYHNYFNVHKMIIYSNIL